MAEKPNQNWEQRVVDSRGPKFRLDVNNPQMGADGPNTYLMYAVTDNKDKQFSALSESGVYRLHNERTIEVVAGSKNSGSDTSVKISSVEGDITITVMGNGQVKIAGGSVIVQADEDIDLKAGRNITLNAAKLGVDWIEVIESDIMDALSKLDRPDAVFIGGGFSAESFEKIWKIILISMFGFVNKIKLTVI